LIKINKKKDVMKKMNERKIGEKTLIGLFIATMLIISIVQVSVLIRATPSANLEDEKIADIAEINQVFGLSPSEIVAELECGCTPWQYFFCHVFFLLEWCNLSNHLITIGVEG
jgi:hypothetical protein